MARTVGHEDVTADKPRRDTERPASLHHQDGEIPATAVPFPQCLLRSLHAFFDAAGVGELVANAAGHGAKYFHGASSFRSIEKLQCPLGHVFAPVVTSQGAHEI